MALPAAFSWPLTSLVDDVWTASTPIRFAGVWFPHVMTVVRLPDGSLLAHSPCRLTPQVATDLRALGAVKNIVAPNWFHDLYLREYREAFRRATIWGPKFLQRIKGKNLIDKSLDGSTPWAHVMPHYVVRGSLTFNETLFFHEPTQTLIVADLLMNVNAPDDAPPLTKLALRLARAQDRLCVFPLLYIALTDRRSLRAAATKMRAWKPKNIIVGHGTPITVDASRRLLEALASL